MDFRDYYATLGVPKTASAKDIKHAYRKLARKFHPDVNPGDKASERQFKEINEAYEVLGDATKRKKYDELGANWRLYDQAPQGYGAPGSRSWTVDFGRDGQTFTTQDFEEAFGGEESPFSDFFRTFFGGPTRAKGARATARRQVGLDVEQTIPLTLEEAYDGTRKRIGVRRGGHMRTVEVRIPAGVRDGARLRVAGEGEPGTGGGAAGDLFLRIQLQPHERFERHGQDLRVRQPISLLTAVLGGEVEVPTLSAKPLRLRIPETTQNGQVFRLRGHGMPSLQRPAGTGDLYVTIEVQLPRALSPEARQHYNALAQLEKPRG